MIICTSVYNNFLPKAFALAESVKKVDSSIKFVICLVEKDIHEQAKKFEYFDDIVTPKDFGKHYESLLFKFNFAEAAMTVKPKLFKYLFDKYPDEHEYIYLDGDCFLYSDLVEAREFLQTYNIVVVPHLLKHSTVKMELSVLKHGIFNLGFLAVNNKKSAREFIDWWSERLDVYCFVDNEEGIWTTDQKWINLAPCFWDVKILKHAGYDYATWSLPSSFIEKKNNSYFIDGDELRFIHFSGIDSFTPEWVYNRQSDTSKNASYLELLNNYRSKLKEYDIGDCDWSYNFFNSGEKILDKTRLVYRKANLSIDDPYELSNRKISNMSNNVKAKYNEAKFYFIYLFFNSKIKNMIKRFYLLFKG